MTHPRQEDGTPSDGQAWIVAVDMGYGHQRAAHPLRAIARERIITANSDKVVEPREKRQWQHFQSFYELVSRLSEVPIAGKALWRACDRLQAISPHYPFRDLSRPNFGSTYLNRLIRSGFARSVPEYARKAPLPFVATFFVPALAADHAGLDRVYCIVTDADISRVWAAQHPSQSRVIYLAPSERAARRLEQYGVPPHNIHLTGFPLPEENLATLRADLSRRIARLDPRKVFVSRYRETIERELGGVAAPDGPVTVTYAVGGAGAQKDVARKIVQSLRPQLLAGTIRVNLIAGTRLEVNAYFQETVRDLGLESQIDRSIHILCALDKPTYFDRFNALLHDTDILWTKPSELVFYTALGLPIVLTPPLGSHEQYNGRWLAEHGAGHTQEDPAYTAEWLAEWIARGMLAECAFDGYHKSPRDGTRNIRQIVLAPRANPSGEGAHPR